MNVKGDADEARLSKAAISLLSTELAALVLLFPLLGFLGFTLTEEDLVITLSLDGALAIAITPGGVFSSA
ncbi:hypothetical protein D3C71_2019850 [compost metagenome]